jgi:hypothetical protein
MFSSSQPSRHGPSAALIATAMALAAAISGCAAQKAADTGEPALGTIAVVRSAGDIVLPLDSYQISADDDRAISNALAILLRQCVAQFGLTFPAGQGSGTVTRNAEPKNARRYFVFDPASAAVNGYRPSEEFRQAQKDVTARRTKVEREPISDDVRNVVEGKGPGTYNGRQIPQGGCSAEAARKLGGDKVDVVKISVQQLQSESYGRMMHDSRVTAVNRRWSGCMKEQGFDYADPKTANDDRRWTSEAISRVEIDTAVADANCKSANNLVGVMLSVETAYQKRLIDLNVTGLNELKKLYEAQLANAATVIAGGGR